MIEFTDIKMTSDLYNAKNSGFQMGVDNPDIAFYLPNFPLMPSPDTAVNTKANTEINSNVDIEKLIELNGNHWRKIFTIMAKITVLGSTPDSWRNHRKQVLNTNDTGLKTALFIKANRLCANAKIHIVCGQQTYDDLTLYLTEGLNHGLTNDFAKIGQFTQLTNSPIVTILGDKQKIMAHKHILIAPYLDYRQFPNQLITELRDYIKQTGYIND